MSEKTQSGLDQNIAGALCYLFVPAVFFWLSEKDNKFVRFHAMQGMMAVVAVVIIEIVLMAIPFIGWILSPLVSLALIASMIFLMYKAFNNEEFMIPYIGEMAKKQINK